MVFSDSYERQGEVMLAEYEYKQRFEQVFQLFSSGLIFISEEGKIIDANPYIEKVLGLDRTELLKMSSKALLNMLSLKGEIKKTFLQDLSTNGQAEFFCELQTYMGDYKYLHSIVSKQSDSNIFLMEIHDESEKMFMKKRLDHNESLSTLGQLAASIAHEIRNPMTSLKGFTQLLLKTATDDGKRYLDVIDHEINRMEDILTEFLQVSKPCNNEYTYFEVDQLITEVAGFMSPQSLMKAIDINIINEIYPNNKVFGNRNLLKQVFINAIKNAIESMEKSGNIEIRISLYSNCTISVKVVDQGSGIEKQDIENIFKPFFTTKSAGTGLGLSHSYEVIEAHGGKIEVESNVGIGTTFNFLLPLHGTC